MTGTLGTLYLLPVALGDTPWHFVMPAATREIACRLQQFIAENAKSARASLKWLAHPMPLRELHIAQIPERLDPTTIDGLVAPLLAGHDVGLLSEAGCPAVADPGALIVRRAHEIGVTVKPLVGPSSLLLGLMASGLDGQCFAFHGYLPNREPERTRTIGQLEKESLAKRQTQLFIETPYRNQALFDALLGACRPATRLCIACDLTTETEYIRTKTITEWRRQEKPVLEKRPALFLLLG